MAHILAQRLGFLMLNTGAMYRAVGVTCLSQGVDLADSVACAHVAVALELEVDGEGRLTSRGQIVDMDGLIGEQQGAAASRVGQLFQVREVLVEAQRRVGEHWDLVTEGRDTTTVVFPAAEHKFFLTASLEERARRRHGQVDSGMELKQLMVDIERRDRQDSERKASPLTQAPDAHVLNTDGLSIDLVVERIQALMGPMLGANKGVGGDHSARGGEACE